MARATIIVVVDEPAEVAACEAWFEKWRSRLTYCSENKGCGCCVDSWDIEGPSEAIDDIPKELAGKSSWTNPEYSKY